MATARTFAARKVMTAHCLQRYLTSIRVVIALRAEHFPQQVSNTENIWFSGHCYAFGSLAWALSRFSA
jgi:hypothetical protein